MGRYSRVGQSSPETIIVVSDEVPHAATPTNCAGELRNIKLYVPNNGVFDRLVAVLSCRGAHEIANAKRRRPGEDPSRKQR